MSALPDPLEHECPPTEGSAADLLRQVVDYLSTGIVPRGLWLVGGYVRDRLLGRTTNDLDIVVTEGAIDLARALADDFGGVFFVLDRDRDVGRVILRKGGSKPVVVDVARLRAPSLSEDLRLRDFTVNAMALDIGPGTGDVCLFDPFGGRTDLDIRLLRVVTEGAFRDDPIRMLRGVRLSAELSFRIDAATLSLMRAEAPLLVSTSAERVRDELWRIMGASGAWRHVRLLAATGLLQVVLPEFAALIGVGQSPPHYQDVFDHTRSVVAHLEGIYAILWPRGAHRRPEAEDGDTTAIAEDGRWVELENALQPFLADLRSHLCLPLASDRLRRDALLWAALAHDWGKPAMRTIDPDGRTRFFAHDRWGALLVRTRAQALRFSADEVTYLYRVAAHHMRPGLLAHDFPPSRRAIYRFFRDTQGTGPDCVLLSLADHMATRALDPDPVPWERRFATSQLLLNAYFRERQAQVEPVPLLDGRQIMAQFGLAPGPRVGQLLEDLREAQAAGEVRSADDAIAWLMGRGIRDPL